jgi:hypothetical protein
MVDNLAFHFIYFAKNEAECLESVRSLDALKVPAGYKLSIMILQGNYSVVEGYNFALRNSGAKYKIYLHKNMKIINHNFLNDVVSLLTQYPNLGMLGVRGALRLPANGSWWEAPERCGKILFRGQLIEHSMEIAADYQPVQVVDGKIMITQYDIPWRNDLFTKPFFYDTAQCLEFIKAGYQVGVPRQNEPWCAYECTHDALLLYQQDREVFVHEYRKFLN